jgi:hypothetical protein
MERYAMRCKRLVWNLLVTYLACNVSSTLAQGPGQVRQVATVAQLQAAITESAPHIEIVEHLDLSGQRDLTSADAFSAASGRMTHFGNPEFRTFRVCI